MEYQILHDHESGSTALVRERLVLRERAVRKGRSGAGAFVGAGNGPGGKRGRVGNGPGEERAGEGRGAWRGQGHGLVGVGARAGGVGAYCEGSRRGE